MNRPYDELAAWWPLLSPPEDYPAVFVHDAILYMTTEADLRRAFATALEHLEPGGVALFAPDTVRERFEPKTDHGGRDGKGRALRYLDWIWDPDPRDDTCLVDFAFLLREGQPSAAELFAGVRPLPASAPRR